MFRLEPRRPLSDRRFSDHLAVFELIACQIDFKDRREGAPTDQGVGHLLASRAGCDDFAPSSQTLPMPAFRRRLTTGGHCDDGGGGFKVIGDAFDLLARHSELFLEVDEGVVHLKGAAS